MSRARAPGPFGGGRRGGSGVSSVLFRSWVTPFAYCFLCCFFCGCGGGATTLSSLTGDIKPPSVLDAKPLDSRIFLLRFDEPVRPIKGSFSSDPPSEALEVTATLNDLKIEFEPPEKPGQTYGILGEVEDEAGNITRFLFTFTGWNDHPASIRLNEVQTGKNSSATAPHRDYVEFLVLGAGNLGGMEVEWASSVKQFSYSFPCAEVSEGDIVVLHLAPQAIAAEVDEAGADLALSGGIDSSPGGRDFWIAVGPLPDESGVILVRARKGEKPIDGIFYAALDKSGSVESDKIAPLVQDLGGAKVWKNSEPPAWEDALLWKSSTSRPFHMVSGMSVGKGRWAVGEANSQSPGLAEPGKGKSRGGARKLKAN